MKLLRPAFLLYILFHSAWSFSQQKPSVPQNLIANSSAIGFIQNFGHVSGMEDGKMAKGIYYVFNSPEAEIYITSMGISYVYTKVIGNTNIADKISDTPIRKTDAHYSVERVDATIVNAIIDTTRVEIVYADNTAHFNYYSATQSLTNQRLIKKITFKNVYPGIDWVIYNTSDNGKQRIKYDFILRQSAVMADINIQYSSNAKVNLNKDKSITVSSKLGSIKEGIPIGFNENNQKKVVGLNYRIKDNCIGFSAKGIVRFPFTIDPDLYWGTMLNAITPFSGKSSYVTIGNIVTDSGGNIYTYAACSGPMNFPTANPGNGAYYSDVYNSSVGNNIYIKFNEKGLLLWSTFFAPGGSGGDIVLDSKENLVTVSYFTTGSIPLRDNGGYFQSQYNPNGNKSYLARFDKNGSLTWSTYWADLSIGKLACDANDNFYLTGICGAAELPRKNPGNGAFYNGTLSYGVKTYISKFDKNCSLVWSTDIPGSDGMEIGRLAVDKNQNIYLLNPAFRNDAYPLIDAGGYFNTIGTEVLTKFDSTLKMVWATRLPGVIDIATDTSGYVYGVGRFNGGVFSFVDPGGGAYMDPYRTIYMYHSGAFILKFDQTTKLAWATTYYSAKDSYFRRIAFEKYRNMVHVYGTMNSSPYMDFPTKNDACNGNYYNPSSGPSSNTDPFIVSFTTSGKLTYASLSGFHYQPNWNLGKIAVDRKGSIIIGYESLDEATFGLGGVFPVLKNPGNGAYFQPVATGNNYLSFASAIIKFTPTLLGVSSSFTAPLNCACSGTISVSPDCGSGNYNYQWSTGQTTGTITGLCAGNYSVTVTDVSNNSTVSLSFVLPNPPGNISVASIQSKDDYCNSTVGSISVTNIIGGPAPYLFSLNNQAFSNKDVFKDLPKGNYQIEVKDADGCLYTKKIDINNKNGPVKIYSSINATACNQFTGRLNIDSVKDGSAPFLYSFNNTPFSATHVFSNLQAGIYPITIKDSAECVLSDSITIKKETGVGSAVLITDNAQCGQTTGSVMITKLSGGKAPFSYSLDNLSFQLDSLFGNLVAGKKNVYVKDINGCLYADSLTLAFKKYPFINLPADTILCNNSSYTMDVSQTSAEYLWDDNSLLSARLVNKPGVYNIKVTNEDKCATSKTIKISYQSTPNIIINKTISQCIEDTLHLDISFPDASYLWQDGSKSPVIDITKKGLYRYSVSNFCGSSSGSIDVSTHTCLCEVLIPNIFSPNGDGINDKLQPSFACTPVVYQFSVYNRGGQLVFSTSDPSAPWDGKLNTKPLPIGTYYFIQKIKGASDPILREKSGSITLIR